MAVVEIKPGSGRIESATIALLTATIIAGTALYAFARPERGGVPELYDWQVSAFDGLSPEDQAIHSAMGPAIAEAVMFYDLTGEWPNVVQMEEDLITPFVRDLFWESNGEVEWSMARPGKTDQGAIYYLGRNGRAKGQSAYLGLIRHAHLNTQLSNQLELWIHDDPGVAAPTALKAEALVGQGWRQVVAHSGNAEHERIHGD